MDDLTIEAIAEVAKMVRHTNRQLQFFEDPMAARKDDMENGRGVLVLSPDLDIENLVVGSLHGTVVEKDGVEYRVIIDNNMRDMKDPETGKTRAGFWCAPLPMCPLPLRK